MNPITRRTSNVPVTADPSQERPAQFHRNDSIEVISKVALGVEPRLMLSWNVKPWLWHQGYTLYIFRNSVGFLSSMRPTDLFSHGRLFVETQEDSMYEDVPEEGSHFFTFVLHKKMCFGLLEQGTLLRFSEIVPSAKVAIGRIRDQMELQSMLQQHELGKIEHEAKMNEARTRLIRSAKNLLEVQNPPPPTPKPEPKGNAFVAEELENIDAALEAMRAKERKIAELKKDKWFRKLHREEQQKIIDRIDERLDPGEASARRDVDRH